MGATSHHMGDGFPIVLVARPVAVEIRMEAPDPIRHRLHRLGHRASLAAHADRTPRAGAVGLLSVATPAWLLGLLLVPAIRWLHRGGPQRRAVPVASLALWRRAETTGPAAGARRPPDPAWRRRALLAALLSLALAGLQSAAPLERITLWVDDSLSMLTREDGGTRLERGLATVAEAAATQPGVAIEVRALGNPWTAHAGPSAGSLSTRAAIGPTPL